MHRILIIEDNIDVAQSLRAILLIKGHKVAVAYDGAEGLEQAKVFGPTVILCDIGLPEIDGYGVARQLRDDEDFNGVYLVALSGYAMAEDVAKSRAAGFDRHIAKPPDMKQLDEVLSKHPG